VLPVGYWPGGACRCSLLIALRVIHQIHPEGMGHAAVSVSGAQEQSGRGPAPVKQGMVVVLNRDAIPNAVMMGLDRAAACCRATGRAGPHWATALFRDGELSLARAARVAEMDTAAFISHLSRLGDPVNPSDGSRNQRRP